MTCAVVGMVETSAKSVSTMPTKLSPVSLAPAKMSLNLIEHMQLCTAGQRACGDAERHMYTRIQPVAAGRGAAVGGGVGGRLERGGGRCGGGRSGLT